MNKSELLSSLRDVYTRLAPVSHGVGVIAIRLIPKGIDPFKNCDPYGSAVEIPVAELDTFEAPEEAKALIRDFCALQDGVYHVPDYGIDAIDKSYFLNHSSNPNMITLDKGESFVTSRDVLPGEELTTSYDSYHESKHFDRA